MRVNTCPEIASRDIDLQHSPSNRRSYDLERPSLKLRALLLKFYGGPKGLGERYPPIDLFGWAVYELNLTCWSNVTDIMVLYVNVLVALVDRLILDRVDRALVIRTDSNTRRLLLEIDISEMRSQDTCNTRVCKLSHSTHM